jgi:hypothetical protein
MVSQTGSWNCEQAPTLVLVIVMSVYVYSVKYLTSDIWYVLYIRSNIHLLSDVYDLISNIYMHAVQ